MRTDPVPVTYHGKDKDGKNTTVTVLTSRERLGKQLAEDDDE